MDTCFLEHDQELLCMPAASFPDGILAAHQQLHARIPYDPARNYYGISFLKADGQIGYSAAAERLVSDITYTDLPVFLLRAGRYHSILVPKFMDQIPAISAAFTQLMQADIDPQGACVEWYFNQQDVRCMIRAAQ